MSGHLLAEMDILQYLLIDEITKNVWAFKKDSGHVPTYSRLTLMERWTTHRAKPIVLRTGQRLRQQQGADAAQIPHHDTRRLRESVGLGQTSRTTGSLTSYGLTVVRVTPISKAHKRRFAIPHKVRYLKVVVCNDSAKSIHDILEGSETSPLSGNTSAR